jgi:hypothetical protein
VVGGCRPIGYAKEADFSEGICDLLVSLKPQIEQFGLNVDAVGDIGTLPGRLQAELVQSNAAGPLIGALSLPGRASSQKTRRRKSTNPTRAVRRKLARADGWRPWPAAEIQ